MSAWFSMLGEPVAADERRLVAGYLRGLDVTEDLPVERVADWNDARAVVTDAGWDHRWWDAEQREKERLWARAVETHGESELLVAVSQTLEASDALRRAAASAAERFGCEDAGLVGSAAGAASQAFHLTELARLAGESDEHPFYLKRALFAAGRWPLGILRGRYRIF
ncbi:MAG TPA: hypothetical protein VMI54_21060 [Polyangiaceae bacterium]|nr:hypothetical protein [Polyangiaceae bacterium]